MHKSVTDASKMEIEQCENANQLLENWWELEGNLMEVSN